jgi:surfeit locus 1 family protein
VKGPDWLGMTVFGSICAAAFGLGTWQIQRYGWKVDLMEKMKGNTKAEPTAIPLEYPADLSPLIPSDFPSDLNQYYLQQFVSEADGRRMTVTGTYDYDNEFLLGPRSAPGILGEQAAQGMSQNPQGYWVITPLHREDGTITLVKRGWVMCDKGTVKLEKQAYEKPKGKVTVTVIADNYEPRTRFAPENSPYTKKLWWYELESVHKILGKFVSNTHGSAFLRFPVMLEAVMEDEEEITTYPVSRRVKAIGEQHVTPATHMVYAVTWYVPYTCMYSIYSFAYVYVTMRTLQFHVLCLVA